MKKVFNSLFVIIAAMVTFAGCQKEENNAPATPETKTVQFFANSIETKTQFGTPEDGTYPTLWSAGDEVTVLVNLDNVANTQKQTTVECSDDFKSANFKAELAKPEAESFTFYSVSPSSALKGKSAAKGYLYVEIPVEQDPLETSVDKKAQVLYAASATTPTMQSSVDFDFHHLTAYGKFSLVNLTDEVSSISKIKIEAPEDVFIAGKWDYFVANDSFVVREGNGSNAITLTTNKTSDIWFAAAPAATTGKTIKFTVTTDKGDLVKEVTFPGDLQAGKIARFAVNMDGINPPAPEVTTAYYKKVTEAPSDWSGTYVLGYTNGTTVKVLSGKNSAGNYGSYTDLTLGENGISSTSVPENCVLTVESSANGYTLFVNNTYLGYTSTATSSSNYLYFATSVTEKKYEWTISLDGSNVLIKSVYNTGRTIKWNSQSPRFACYTSGQSSIQLYRLEEGNSEPEQPKVLSSIAVSGQKTEYYVGEEFVAPTVTATYEGGATAKVTATFTGYDLSEAGTHTVTVSYTENSVTKTTTYYITVSEAPEIEELTVAEFLSAEKSDVVWYQLTGIITEIRDASWGNITIKDATESVYIYGLTKTKVSSNDKSFSSLGLKVGDQVTLVTVRGEYNGTAQGGGTNTPAYFISCVAAPYLTVTPSTINVAATATSAEFTVDANVEWTVSCSNATATKSEGKVTVSFATNETAESVVYEVVVTSELGNETITITQAAVSQGGGEQVSKSYVEMFSTYSDAANSNTKNVTIAGDACSWTGVGVTTAYWGNFSWGSYNKGVTFLKPGSADAVYLVSETLSGGITNLSIAAAANATNAKIKVSVINVDNNNAETVLGTVTITSKKTKFTGSWEVTGVSGNYKIKIYNNATAGYVNVTDVQWNNN